MHSVIPHAKLIYILRDPMERLISQIIDDFSSSDSYQDLRAALLPFGASPFIAPSLQCLQLEQFVPYYKLSQILLIDAKELAQKRPEIMAKVFRFLGVDETFTSKNFSLMLNPRSVKRERTRAYSLVKRFLALDPGRMIPYRLGLPVRHWLMRTSARPLRAPVFDPELEARLLEVFHEDALRLRRLTGLKLEDWRV
jgi:Sulfotransferase domain